MASYTTADEAPGHPLTMVYKLINDLPIHLDVYPPSDLSATAVEIPRFPAVVYFHGGALTVGNRKSWFPAWLYRRVVSAGMVFISADYRLLPPATGHDILADILDLFRFLQHQINQCIEELLQTRASHAFHIDTGALAVAGSSAGSLCAYLAAIHAVPKPKAVLSLYGMGGNFLTWQYLTPKTKPFFRGREILDPIDFAEYTYPSCWNLSPSADSPLAYHPATYHIPGYPANPRMLLGRLYLQTGTFLDYFTGSHQPSLSLTLREQLSLDNLSGFQGNASSKSLQHYEKIPASHRILFPQFCVTSDLPPVFFVHGDADTAVLVAESQNLHRLLQHAGVPCELQIVEGKEHSFDYDPTADTEFGEPGGLFDQAVEFLNTHLHTQRM